MKIDGKLKEEFVNNETRSVPYLLDMAVTIKVARTQMEQLQTKFQLDHVTLATPLYIHSTFCDHSSKTEGAIR